MPEPGIEYQDITNFNAALDKFPQHVDQMVRTQLGQALDLLRGDMAVYPATTSANSPPGDGYRWYERGFGTRTVTGKAYPTSEKLGQSWTTKVSGSGPWEGLAGTTASYAPYVKDEAKQANAHKGRHKTVQDTLKDMRAQVLDLLRQGIRQAIALVRQ